MDYACMAWYFSLSAMLKNKLQIVQNKLARFITNSGPRQHIGHTELSSIGYLNVQDRVTQLSMNMMHNIFYDRCPAYMNSFFTKISDVHNYNTRGSNYNFRTPKINSISATTFYYNATAEWNRLPDSIKCIQNKSTFKEKVRWYLGNRHHE